LTDFFGTIKRCKNSLNFYASKISNFRMLCVWCIGNHRFPKG